MPKILTITNKFRQTQNVLSLIMLSSFSIDLIRNVADCYSRLESISNNSRRIKDLFKPKANQIRDRIRQQCENLLLDDSLRNSRKAIEFLWKYCYHSFMQFYKKHKRSIKTDDEYNLLVSYFQAGTGYFYSVLFKLSNDYGGHLAKFVPELTLDNFEDEEFKKKPDSYIQAIANQCIHRILICLGDLYRYLDILGKENCRLLAVKWYNAAFLFDKQLGMPFNQLGSLAGTDNYNLDSVYYYIRCLNCKRPFDNAEDNLKYIFNLSKGLMNEINILGDNNSECVFLVKKCLIEFIHLINLFWFETTDISHLTQFIGTTLNTFNRAIQLKIKPTNARKPTFLCPETVFHLTVIIIILNHKFQTKSVSGDKLHSTLNSVAIGFALNFLFYLINAVIKQVKEKNIVDKFTNNKDVSNIRTNSIKENGYSKKSLFKLRRKANIRMSNDNEDSLFYLLDDEDEDDMNELEETALSTIDALEMSSDMSENGSDICDTEDEDESTSNSILTSDDEGSSSQHNSNNSSNNKNISTTYEIGRFLAYLYNESILPSIKLLLDWLTVNEHLFGTYHQAFDSLFSNFVDLLNLLLELEEKALRSNENLNKFRYTSNDWKQTYPLSIDISVSNLDALEDYHAKNIDFEQQLNLSEEETGFVCLQNIIAFGHHIKGGLSKYRIEFDTVVSRFNLIDKNEINGYDELVNLNHENTIIIENGFDYGSPTSMKNSLMQDFVFEQQMNSDIIPNVSHIWLDKPMNRENGFLKNSLNQSTNRINQLNNKNKFLPYLIIDITGYSNYLELVKELYNSREWMILVPKIVLEELGKQKNSYESKDAIKWIKHERQRGTKYLRFLKSDERLSVSNIHYPLKKEKTAHDFHILLEHCNYLNRKSIAKYTESGLKDGLDDKVILLYGRNNCFPVNYEELLDKIGVRSQDLTDFVKKWRLSNNGKT